MFTMPSLSNILFSTIAFFAATWYVRRRLDQQGMPKGVTRSMLVLTLATAVSVTASAAIDWVQDKVSGTAPAIQAPQPAPNGEVQG